MKGRKRSVKGDAVRLAAVHRVVIRSVCNRWKRLEPRDLDLLLLANAFDQVGGYFTRPELLSVCATHYKGFNKLVVQQGIERLLLGGFVCYDESIKPRAFRPRVLNITFQGDLVLRYYSREANKVLDTIHSIPHGRDWYNRQLEQEAGRATP